MSVTKNLYFLIMYCKTKDRRQWKHYHGSLKIHVNTQRLLSHSKNTVSVKDMLRWFTVAALVP